MDLEKERLINSIINNSRKLNEAQLAWINKISNVLSSEMETKCNENSDLLNKHIANYFGNALLMHHCFSAEPFSKDKFEYVLEQTFLDHGIQAKRAPKGNPGRDITINGVHYSLKTQADNNINENIIHVSKFMEMGKGTWTDKLDDLNGLRDRFLAHMQSYQRIITLRTLKKVAPWHYELVEIPKELLEESANGKLEMMFDSSQMPKPGYCRVFNEKGDLKYSLYFDGGGERKLQIKGLKKDLCTVHAEWKFKVSKSPD